MKGQIYRLDEAAYGAEIIGTETEIRAAVASCAELWYDEDEAPIESRGEYVERVCDEAMELAVPVEARERQEGDERCS